MEEKKLITFDYIQVICGSKTDDDLCPERCIDALCGMAECPIWQNLESVPEPIKITTVG